MSSTLKAFPRKRIRSMGFDIVRSPEGEFALSRRKAVAQLSSLEARKGETPKPLVRQADEYATEVLGDKKFALWLHVYAAMAGEFRDGWMPKDYYKLVVLPEVNGAYGQLAKLKSMYVTLFSPDESVDLCGWVNQRFISPVGEWLSFDAAVQALFAKSDRVIFKPDQSNEGRGLRVFDRGDITPESTAGLPSGVFQAFVQQHPDLAAYCPTAVATLRLTTVIESGGTASLRGGRLRIGRAEEKWVHSSTQVNIPISLDSGGLNETGYFADWTPVSVHPDSRLPFSGFKIPSYDEAVSLVLDLHTRFPYVQTIGWDIAIDEDGRPQVMEWNGDQPGIGFQEWTQGPCFTGLGWEDLWREDRKD